MLKTWPPRGLSSGPTAGASPTGLTSSCTWPHPSEKASKSWSATQAALGGDGSDGGLVGSGGETGGGEGGGAGGGAGDGGGGGDSSGQAGAPNVASRK